jgi:hypothetical protein
MTGRVCNLQCNRWLVRSLRTNNHTLPSHLWLCSLFVASYNSQGLRWRYSNPPPHGVFVPLCARTCFPYSGYVLDGRGVPVRVRIIPLHVSTDRVLGPTQPPHEWFSWMSFPTNRLVSRSRIRESIPLLPHTSTFRNAQLHESRATLTFYDSLTMFWNRSVCLWSHRLCTLHCSRRSVGKCIISQVTSLPICCLSVFIILSRGGALKPAASWVRQAGAVVKEGLKCSVCV